MKTNPWNFAATTDSPHDVFRRFRSAVGGQDGFRAVYATGKTVDNRDFTIYVVGRIMVNTGGQITTGYEVHIGNVKIGMLSNVDQLNLFLAWSKWQVT